MAELTTDNVSVRVNLLEELRVLADKSLGEDKGCECNQMIMEYERMFGRITAPGERGEIHNAVLRMDKEISALIVEQGFSALNSGLDGLN